MILTLLACLNEPADPSRAAGVPSGGDELPLPEGLPFSALSRSRPTTLVDEKGQPILVLEALGVSLRVQHLLVNRALVTCNGCRAPVEGWVQREALLPADGSVHPGDDDLTADDEMLLFLSAAATPEQSAALSGGLVASGGGWYAPAWCREGGYSGPAVYVKQHGDTWEITPYLPSEAPAPTEKPQTPQGPPPPGP